MTQTIIKGRLNVLKRKVAAISQEFTSLLNDMNSIGEKNGIKWQDSKVGGKWAERRFDIDDIDDDVKIILEDIIVTLETW